MENYSNVRKPQGKADMNPLWSWTITILGLTSTWLLAHHKTTGWPTAITTNITWITYAIQTHQPTFILAAGAYIALNIHGWRTWHHDNKPHPQPLQHLFHTTRRNNGTLHLTTTPPTIIIDAGLITTLTTHGETPHLKLTKSPQGEILEIRETPDTKKPTAKYKLTTHIPADAWTATLIP